jgi:CRP-like cAMP-binding protein
MESAAELLLAAPLFKGFTAEQLNCLLKQLAPTVRHYKKGESLLTAGSENRAIGLVLAGSVEAVKYTRAGAQFTVMRAGPGGVFGDVLSGSGRKSPVTVRALAPCRAMWITAARLFAAPAEWQALYNRLLANLVGVISNKYFALDARVDLLLIRGMRRRLAAFLLDSAGPDKSACFTVPCTRAQLADLLGFERSALSRELSNMARDGLIETTRRRFRIPDPAALKELF